MIRQITTIPSKNLHEPSKKLTKTDIESADVQELIADMIPSMYAAHGIGLAAPQVGINLHVCIIGKDCIPHDFPYTDSSEDLVLINPAYERKSKRAVLETEGCLSVPGKQGKVRRYKHIDVTALDASGNPISFEAGGYFAHVIQHETDHLNGTLYIDKAERVWEME